MTRIADHLVRAYYYDLGMDSGEEEVPFLSYYAVGNNLKDFDFHQFESNQPIVIWPSEAVVYVLGEVPTDFMYEENMRIVSDRFRQALVDFGVDDVQFLPIRAVHQESGKDVGNYWVLHAYQHIEGLDWEYTVWQKMRGTELEKKYPKEEHPFLYIMEPVFIWEKVKDAYIFQLTINGKPDINCPIYISNDLKEYLDQREVNIGVYFIKVPVH